MSETAQVRTGVLGSDVLFANRRMSVDDTALYLTMVHTLLPHCRVVVDVGCGRGAYLDPAAGRSDRLFDLRGSDRRIIGLDVDPAARDNPYLDEFRLLDENDDRWPLPDAGADLVVSDWTLEHVRDPDAFVSQLRRVLRPGGAFVARSVSAISMLSIAARLVPNRHHATALRRLQPRRRSVDVFPTYYRMNRVRDIERLFGPDFDFSLSWRPGLENYFRVRHPRVASTVAALERVMPQHTHTAFVLSARRLGADSR
jgi:SAM-dependent methyltransferase